MSSLCQRHITLSVAHSIDQIPQAPDLRERTISIVIDVIRATTTLAVMFEQGARRVYVARDVAAARAAHPALADALLAGEVDAVAPPDFDHGNSPEEWGRLDLTGRDILFSTTNGARALHAARGGPILAGSLRNATAVSVAALAEARRLGEGARILAVCSGRGGLPAEDDSLCAAWLIATVHTVAERQETPVALDGIASSALDLLATSDRRRQGDAVWLHERLLASEPARDVLDAGLDADIAWCAALDVARVVPTVTGYDAALDLLIVEGRADQ